MTAPRTIVLILNPGKAPADNGRTIHAFKLAGALKRAGAEVKTVFSGEAVTWIDRFENRSDDSHPFVKNYAYAYDEIRDTITTCNMCNIRFDATEAVTAAGLPIAGEGKDHIDLAPDILEGWQVVTF